MALPVETWIAMALLGVLAGVLSSLMGVGGGLVIVPALHFGLGMPWLPATIVSLWAIAIQTPVGLWRHHARGAVSWRTGLLLSVGGAVGVVLGDWSQPQIPVAALKLLFVVVLGWASYRIYTHGAVHKGDLHWSVVALTGVLAGVLAKWLGIGGGLVLGPVLVLAGMAAQRAVATSLVPVWTNALIGALIGVSVLAPGDGWLIAALGAGALGGAPLGVRLAHRLPEKGLRRVVAVLLATVALAMLGEAAWPTLAGQSGEG